MFSARVSRRSASSAASSAFCTMVRVFAPESAERNAAVTSGRSVRALALSELKTHPSPMSALTMPLACAARAASEP